MRYFACILSSFIFFADCSCKESNKKETSRVQIDLNKEGIIKRFALPFDESLQLDSSNLIFYYTKPFDTSFVVHLKNINGVISGVYYQVLPSFHSDLENYFDQKAELLFFDGYSFIIDNKQWGEIKTKAKELFAKDSTITGKTCFDCSSYFLSHDFKIRRDNNDNKLFFERLADYLKSTIISRFNNIKREREEFLSSQKK